MACSPLVTIVRMRTSRIRCEQGTQISCRRIRHPDGRPAVVFEQVEQVERVPPVGLRLPHDHGPDLGRVTNEQGVPKLAHQGVKPQRVSGALDRHGDGARQGRIELLDVFPLMAQLDFLHLACFRIQHCHLLLPCMQVATHESHRGGLLTIGAVRPQQPNSSRHAFSWHQI
jgi:hypothetical protein